MFIRLNFKRNMAIRLRGEVDDTVYLCNNVSRFYQWFCMWDHRNGILFQIPVEEACRTGVQR